MVGGLIMAHGDDNGLIVPPHLAPTQVVVIAVREDDEVIAACNKIAAALKSAGVRVRIDNGGASFGRRVTDWEIKGVPIRVEVGPRDLAEGVVALVRRDSSEKVSISPDAVAANIPGILEQMQSQMFESQLARRNANTHDVKSIEEAMEASQTGFARLDWDLVGPAGEAKLKTDAITVRCLQRRDGSMPVTDTEKDLICIVAKSY